MNTDIVGFAMGVLGILIGILASYYFYRKSLREKQPIWAIRSNNLIEGLGSNFENLQVTYKGRSIENLTISKLIFWNKGAETINKSDIETIYPPRITVKNEAKLLGAKILAYSNKSNQFKVLLDENNNFAYIEFDYLDEQQGAIIQVVHTGTSSGDIEILGDIKGVRSIRQQTLNPRWLGLLRRYDPRSRFSRKNFASAVILLGTAYFFIGVAQVWSSNVGEDLLSIQSNNSDSSSVIGFLLLSLGGLLLSSMGLALLKSTRVAPKGLEIFDSE